MGWSHKKEYANSVAYLCAKLNVGFICLPCCPLNYMLDCNLRIHCYKAIIRCHYPLVTSNLCASPWIKFLTAGRLKDWAVHSVVYLMRLDQRWSNKSELRLLKDSLLLATWHSQPARKICRGLATRVNGDLMFSKWQCTAAGEAKEASQTLVLQVIVGKWRGKQSKPPLFCLDRFVLSKPAND